MPGGTVVAFDDAKGFGTVREDGTGVEHFFHCTAIGCCPPMCHTTPLSNDGVALN